MKRFLCLPVLGCVLGLASMLHAAPPTPVFSASKPGLKLPFQNDGNVDTWGWQLVLAGWSFDGTSGMGDSAQSIARYHSTMANDPGHIADLSANEDWVLSMEFSHTGDDYNDQAFVVKNDENTADETRVLDLLNNGGGTYRIRAGNNTIASFGVLNTGADFFHQIVVHFKADGLGGGLYDAYLDGSLVGSDVASTVTDNKIDFLQLNTYTGAVDKYRNIMMAPVPEPASLSLLALGGLLCVRRGRSR